jgi:hypothetical protein
MPELYYLEKNVITAEERKELIELILSDLTPDLRPHYMHKGMLNADVFQKENLVYEPLRRAVKICNDTFLQNYTMKYNRFELKRLFGNVMETGAINDPHDDDGDRYPGKPAIEEHYSAVLMLNDDYEGGELYFQHHGVEIRLEAGDLIMFRGNAENLHGVREVVSGKRINVIIFFRNIHIEDKYDEDFWQEFIANYNRNK